MKQKLFLSGIFVFIFFQITSAQTPVQGGIYSNTTWTLANSPYLMNGNIVVFPGVTLTIEPGVEVRVKENGLTGMQYSLETRGTIQMVGQPGARITFRADTDTTTVGAWAGIVVKNSQGGAVNFDYVSISNAIYPVAYDSWIPGLIALHQSEFRYNFYAITVGTELYAEDCVFRNNQSAVYGWSIFTFKNCLFDGNSSALPIYASSLSVENCTFTNNNLGIFLTSGSVGGILVKNTLFDNNTLAFDNANNGLIDSCIFSNNDEGLKNTVNIEVRNSTFYNNQTALQVGFGSSVHDCEINDNETGIALGPLNFGQPMPNIENNRICFNTAYNIDNRTDLNMFIPTNCFCITDSSLIEEKILDGYDDITKGLISYAIFDTSCTTVLSYVLKSPTTGLIDNLESKETIVFPNPFMEILNIGNAEGYQDFQVLNLQGQLKMSGSLAEGENRLDVTNFTPGIYFLGLMDSDKKSRYIKVVKN
jgi:parallel beta-helix repeat protein